MTQGKSRDEALANIREAILASHETRQRSVSPELREELLQQMARLLEEQQKRVLAFVKGLVPATGGVPGKDLLKFSGVIGQADLQMMAAAIEQGCEGYQ